MLQLTVLPLLKVRHLFAARQIQLAAFTNLRVWQDLNQDGISQANELTPLADAGIASINVRRLLLGVAANDVSYQLVERRVA